MYTICKNICEKLFKNLGFQVHYLKFLLTYFLHKDKERATNLVLVRSKCFLNLPEISYGDDDDLHNDDPDIHWILSYSI